MHILWSFMDIWLEETVHINFTNNWEVYFRKETLICTNGYHTLQMESLSTNIHEPIAVKEFVNVNSDSPKAL